VADNLLTIAFASDARYMCLTAAAAWTALKKLPPDSGPVCIMLLASEVGSGSIRAFERAIRSARPDVEFRLIDQHPREAHEIAARTRAPMAQFLRLYAPEHAAPEAQRLIYLDSDILVKDDLRKLSGENLDGRVIGAVIDFNYPTLRRRRQSLSPAMAALDCWKRLPEEGAYLNSGVLLFDVPQWRALRTREMVVDHILRNARAIPIRDQDAMVQCLEGQWHPLPLRWNAQTIGRFHMPQLSKWDKRETHGVCPDEVPDPGVVHYNGSKPLRWGVSPRGRTRADERDICKALVACGYYHPITGAAQSMHLHLRGAGRSVFLECKKALRSGGESSATVDACLPAFMIPHSGLSLASGEGGAR
jgi:UDP-D-galactose:(glucosyl)LPS alpha-1,3-D-galactosyltransferase